MAKSIHLQIVTPRKVVFEGEVEKFTAPGVVGPFQVLYNHAPIVAALTSGPLSVTPIDGQTSVMAVSGGVLELNHNKATILADAIELPKEIDAERARKSLQRAQERIKTRQGIDLDRAEASATRALARLKIAGASINLH